ncbi:periplasmic protein [Variovorax sp. PBS-H4]|uniref:BON domain-containing protein n=1 Tax=Variovorax sp. PBS-H4 TaxID=434008 RepID=UPI001318B477|nr:BON domain-containing protein [Variovorax sp. PBS-H4]VTU21438.1 periplasmic protein [Variovorax sp. PBS-H4]
MRLNDTLLPRLLRSPYAFVLAGAVLASLSACSDREAAESRANVDAAVEKSKDATVSAAHKAADLADKARDNTVNYFKSPGVKEDVDAAKQALKNAGGALSSSANDAAVTASVSAAIARDPELGPRQIDVASSAGTVRLSGSAPSAEAKTRAEQIARTVNGVDKVDNRITVTAAN